MNRRIVEQPRAVGADREREPAARVTGRRRCRARTSRGCAARSELTRCEREAVRAVGAGGERVRVGEVRRQRPLHDPGRVERRARRGRERRAARHRDRGVRRRIADRQRRAADRQRASAVSVEHDVRDADQHAGRRRRDRGDAVGRERGDVDERRAPVAIRWTTASKVSVSVAPAGIVPIFTTSRCAGEARVRRDVRSVERGRLRERDDPRRDVVGQHDVGRRRSAVVLEGDRVRHGAARRRRLRALVVHQLRDDAGRAAGAAERCQRLRARPRAAAVRDEAVGGARVGRARGEIDVQCRADRDVRRRDRDLHLDRRAGQQRRRDRAARRQRDDAARRLHEGDRRHRAGARRDGRDRVRVRRVPGVRDR